MSSESRPWSANTDIISFSALQLVTTVGPDAWKRVRPQPISLTLHLHLSPSYLDAAGESDDVTDTIHYGNLVKAIQTRVGMQTQIVGGYSTVRAFIEDVTDAAFAFVMNADQKKAASEVIHAVRVIVGLSKKILLAGGFEVDLTTRATDVPRLGGPMRSQMGAIVRMTNLILPVLIGVNPPERLAKQRIATHITFFESARTIAKQQGEEDEEEAGGMGEIDYPAVAEQITTTIQDSTYLTLEKLVCKIIGVAYSACDSYSSSSMPQIAAITVRCEKPSALSFADASEIEMTRTREVFQGRNRS